MMIGTFPMITNQGNLQTEGLLPVIVSQGGRNTTHESMGQWLTSCEVHPDS